MAATEDPKAPSPPELPPTFEPAIRTIAITAMVFHRPVCVGDEVSCSASVAKTGNTSTTIKIESWARRARGADTVPIKVTEGIFTYVKVDADGHPVPVSPV